MADYVSDNSVGAVAAGPSQPARLAARSRVQSVDRAALLLRAVAAAAAEGTTTTLLAHHCQLNRATAWRILSTLQVHGFVDHDAVGGRWRLGGSVPELVRVAGLDAVLHDVQSVLQHVALQTGETAALAVQRNGALVYVDEAAPAAVVTVSWIGQSVSLHATSTGKVLLAWSTRDDVERLIPRRLARFTEATITDREALDQHLLETRERGYATCAGEFDRSAWGVSSPVLDPGGRLVAVLSIWGPPPRVTAARFAALADVTQEAAARVAPQPRPPADPVVSEGRSAGVRGEPGSQRALETHPLSPPPGPTALSR